MEVVIIGIDPDVDKSGICTLTLQDRKLKDINIQSLGIGAMFWYLQNIKQRTEQDGNVLRVVVEAGWKNKSNWHVTRSTPPYKACQMGVSVGRNQQVGHCIVEWCQYNNIKVVEQAPLPKGWKGKDGKITHEELVFFAPINKSRTNQEERDAVLLAWVHANLPIKCKVR